MQKHIALAPFQQIGFIRKIRGVALVISGDISSNLRRQDGLPGGRVQLSRAQVTELEAGGENTGAQRLLRPVRSDGILRPAFSFSSQNPEFSGQFTPADGRIKTACAPAVLR